VIYTHCQLPIATPLRRSYVIVAVCLSFVGSVCLSVCEQDYCKSNQPISVKLGVMIGPTSRKNRLLFGGDAVPDTQPYHVSTSLTIAEQGF